MSTAPAPPTTAAPAAPAAAGADAAAAAAVPKKKVGVMKLAIIAVVALGALGGGGWFLAPRLLGKAPLAAAKPAPVVVKATYGLGPVVVNIAGEARRYARVGVSVGLPSAKDLKEVEEAKAQLLDLIIAVLSEHEAEELVTADGREQVKEEMLERIREELHLEKVARVYFTEFVIQ
jgi:flagellar FliL protein